MGKVNKAYVDSHFRTFDSVSDSDVKFELKDSLDLPDNTICYVDDISIPHTWRTLEAHNNKFYVILKTGYLNGSDTSYNWEPYVLMLPEGNYSGSNLATGFQELLNGFADTFTFEVIYHPARGTTSIE